MSLQNSEEVRIMDQKLMLQIVRRSRALAEAVVLCIWLLVAESARAKHCLRRLRTDSEGAATVEFAIILFTMILLIMGSMDLGHMFYIQHVITNASREGARYAAKYTGNPAPTSTQISDYVTSSSGLNYDSFNLNNLVVSASYTGTSPNEIVTVTVKADKYWWILNTLPGFATSKTLTARTAMTVEGP